MMEQFHYQCTDCEQTYDSDGILYLCPRCAGRNSATEPPLGVLRVIYDYEAIRKTGKKDLFKSLLEERFLPLLPIKSLHSLPFLNVGNTPVYELEEKSAAGDRIGCYLKDDSQNPTFSFKDRASALVSAWAKEHGIKTIVAASTGNAGSSLAGICASQKQKAIIFVPAAAPVAKLTQIMMYGAQIIPVDGTYDQAFDLSTEASKRFGFYNRNTAFNPFTIEGKKTVSYEIFHQLNETLPDRIFIPVGDAVILSGVYKGFEDLLRLGIIDKMPEMIAVQAEGSSNMTRNLGKTVFTIQPAVTIADSISVDIPRNFRMASNFLKKYSGKTLLVSDTEILEASSFLSRHTGIFTEPAAAAAYAGFRKLNSQSLLEKGSRNVILLTGSGLKDLKSVQKVIHLPQPVSPELSSLDKLFNV